MKMLCISLTTRTACSSCAWWLARGLQTWGAFFGNEATSDTLSGYGHSGIVEETGIPGIVAHSIGINGATSHHFGTEDMLQRIKEIKLDLIIVSLGTNTAVGKYDRFEHYNMMDTMYSGLKNSFPDANLLFTTPPGAFKPIYNKAKKRRYRRIIRFEDNFNTKQVAKTINRFAKDKKIAVWDLFNIVGGEELSSTRTKSTKFD